MALFRVLPNSVGICGRKQCARSNQIGHNLKYYLLVNKAVCANRWCLLLDAVRSRRRHRIERRRRMRSKRRRRSTERPPTAASATAAAATVVSRNRTPLEERRQRQRRRRRAIVFDHHDIHRLHHDVDACYHRAVDACAWPQCNVACPRVRNPFTGREMDLVELLRAQMSADTGRRVDNDDD